MSLNAVFSDINLPAVLAAGIIHMAIGLIWFMPKVFGNAWAELTGKEMKPASRWIHAGILAHLVMALVLAVIIHLANATRLIDGIAVGVLVWIGFIVPLETGELIWEKIPFKLFMIRVGNHLVGLTIAGMILAVWR